MNTLYKIKHKFKFINRLVWLTGAFSIYQYTKEINFDFLRKIFRSKNNLERLKEKYGNGWVIISGATSGVGLSFTKELAKLGYNTLLISRDEEKLNKVCDDMKSKFNIKTKKIVFDFRNSMNQNSIEKLREEISNQLGEEKISIVINNVGIQFESDRKFEEISTRQLIDYVSVNIMSQLVMYNLLLTKLKNQKDKSLILDVSSLSDDVDLMPVNTVYQSTKSFNAKFSNLMNRQLETQTKIEKVDRNVDIALFKPGMTVSNLTDRHKTKNFISDYPDNVVINCLFDIANGDNLTRGTFRHRFIYWISRNCPQFIKREFIIPRIYQQYNLAEVKKEN